MANPTCASIHFIGKDIVTFHTLFWPACCTSAAARRPTTCSCTAFDRERGEKMSKSRGTGLDPPAYLQLGMNAEWLRLLHRRQAERRNEDIDFNADDFVARVNSDLIGKYINIASRCRLPDQAL